MSDAVFVVAKTSGKLTIGDRKEIDKVRWRKPHGLRLPPDTYVISYSRLAVGPAEVDQVGLATRAYARSCDTPQECDLGIGLQFSLKKVIDFVVGYSVSLFVGTERTIAFEIRGWHLKNELLWSSKSAGNRTHAPFVQTHQRQNICRPISKFRENPIRASAAWSVPMTRPRIALASVNCAIMRWRALILPRRKSA
jgi:hypothetical protein